MDTSSRGSISNSSGARSEPLVEALATRLSKSLKTPICSNSRNPISNRDTSTGARSTIVLRATLSPHTHKAGVNPPSAPTMSSRGRKRNDNLPPSRAREVQRAFRARRKQHLAALEERIDVLEAENARLRQMLALPPSDRQPLGRGPTGREPPRRPPPDAGTNSAPDPNLPAGSPPPPPISPGGQHGRSPSAGAWPPSMQPSEWPPNPQHHPPPPPGPSGVRPPSPYSHLGTYPPPGQRAEPRLSVLYVAPKLSL
ncbi:hypothetical protein OPQ81_000187 [Rhizoctonia solani]|nr:hypothetical protein OPQ81_000187 [Rhizoctonia solani]